MKNKIFTLLSLSVLALVMIAGFVSADVLSEWDLTIDEFATNVATNVDAGDFVVSSGVTLNAFDATDGAVAEDWETAGSADSTKYFEVTIAPDTDYVLTISDIDFDYSASIAGPAIFDLEYSTQTGFTSPTNIVTESDVGSSSFKSSANDVSIQVNSGETLTLRWFGYDFSAASNEFMIKNLVIEGAVELVEPNFCLWDDGWDMREMDNPGELKIRDIDVINNGISSTEFGDDENWFPFEEIEVEIEIENKGDYDVDDIVVEWGLYSEETGEWTIEIEDESEFNLKEDGDREILTISFLLNDRMDEDLDELDGDYRLYVRATGVIDDSKADELDGADTCASDYSQTSIEIEKDFIILDNLQVVGVGTASCGTDVQITADIWNIGSKTQDEVSVRAYNEELGINEIVQIGDIDAFEDEKFPFSFQVPSDAEEKAYTILFTILDEDGDSYYNDYDNDIAEFRVDVEVEGNCINEPRATVSAELESEAKPDSDLVIRTTIINTGVDTSTFEISAGDFSSWATLVSIVPSSITLDAGDSADLLITLNVNPGVSGDQDFNILVTEDQKVLSTPVIVRDITGKGFPGFTGNLISEGSWPIWAIGAINVVLIFVIILVALKVAKK